MKALTGLPPSAYLKISEEAQLPLSTVLRLVQELEGGSTPAYIAHCRPDLAGGADEDRLRLIETRLREFLDLEDRRVTILTVVTRQDRLTPELRTQIEGAMDRWTLEDLYLPFKQKRKTAADEAKLKGLEPLARVLWEQEPADADMPALAAKYVEPERGIASASVALRFARYVVAQWLEEDAEVRRNVRQIVREESQLVVLPGKSSGRDEAAKKRAQALKNYRAKLPKVGWRQMMAIRRSAKETGLRYEIVLPENKVVAYLLNRVIRNRLSPFCLQLGAAAREAFHGYLAPTFQNEARQALNERCDGEAIAVFKGNLRKLLMNPPAGRVTVVGLETGRPGGWRAAVVDPEGRFLEGAIVHPQGKEGTPDQQTPPTADEQRPAETTNAAGASDSSEEKAGGEAEAESTVKQAEPAMDESTSSENVAATPVAATGSDSAAPATAVVAAQTESEKAEEPTAQDSRATPSAEPAPDAESVPAEKADANGTTGPEVTVTPEPTPGVATESAEVARESARASDKQRKPTPSAKSGDKLAATPRGSLADLIKKHNVEAIVMANGPGVRQTERLVRGAAREAGSPKVYWTTISEAGSWIYATSKAARREFRDLEPALRSAVCLARRHQNPLTQLVLVDPKVLGVGQFHHDVDQKSLRLGLEATVASCVHEVGVSLNTGSVEMLSLVPGITERVAKRIVEHRKQHGDFARREQLQDVPGLSSRIYKQAVGFLRVDGGENALDGTGIHPDYSGTAEKLLAAAGVTAAEALEKPEALDAVQLEELQDESLPIEVLRAIARQFQPSVRNPRGEFVPPQLPVELRAAEELKVGTKVEGIVTNVANFGAFVDIGADQDGLVHISQLSEKFVKDPKAAVKVGDQLAVYILALDEDGKRISLSVRDPREAVRKRRQAAASARPPADSRRRTNGTRRRRKEPQREGVLAKRSFGPSSKAKAREEQEFQNLSLDEKLALLKTKYKTKV